jgi:hypothetical protein
MTKYGGRSHAAEKRGRFGKSSEKYSCPVTEEQHWSFFRSPDGETMKSYDDASIDVLMGAASYPRHPFGDKTWSSFTRGDCNIGVTAG